MRREKSFLLIFLIFLLVLCLFGCGTDVYKADEAGVKPEKENRQQEKSIVLTVLAGQSTSDAGIEDMINEAVEIRFPEVRLEWECVDWGESFDSQMRARIAAGDIPDIIVGKAQDAANYGAAGILAPVGAECTQRVSEDALKAVTLDGKSYGLPYNALYQGVLYNKTIFEEWNLSIPSSREDMEHILEVLQENGVTPFACHFLESWKVGNMTMQFMINDIFKENPHWGDDFRQGLTQYSGNETMIRCLEQTQLIRNNTWKDAMIIDQYECDSRFASSEAAMYLTGSWSLQFANQYENPEQFGIFPYPDESGESMLIRETNMTFMKSAGTKHGELIDAIFYELATNEKLAGEILDFTQTYSVLQGVQTAGQSLIREDVARYESEGRVIEATAGNNQLIWSYQNDVASMQLEWLKGNITLEEVLEFADSHRQESGVNISAGSNF